MVEKIKGLALKHKELAVYTFLNYFDKLIAFALPLSVLYISKNQQAYNDIEYIFSFANIAVVLMEFGLKTYFFYGYRIAESRETFVENVKRYFDTLLLFYVILGAILLPITFLVNPDFHLISLFILIRALFLLFTGFNNNYYRLIDRPSLIFRYTIPVNVISIIAILIISLTQMKNVLAAFFIPEALLILFVLYQSKKISLGKFSQLSMHIKTALSYSWPIILNVLLISYINNYAKIHAYNNMSSDDMFQLSFLLRISLIIQMMHVSISGYYSKQIFIDKNHGISRKILLLYSSFLLIAVLLVLLFIKIMNMLPSIQTINLNIITFIIILYTLIWCLQAFLELYLSKYNKPKMILVFSTFSTTIYVLMIFLGNVISILQLSLIMLITIATNFMLTLGYLEFKLFKRFEKLTN